MRRRLAAVLLLAPLAACALTLDASRTGVPVTLASAGAAPATGTRFAITKHATYGLWGLATLSEPSLDRVLKTQLVGAKEIRDVRVRVKSRWSDVLISVLTAGLIVPRTVTVEGTVVADSTLAVPVAAPAASPR